MDDERTGMRAPFGDEDPLTRRGIQRVRAQTVHRFGRNRYQLAFANEPRGLVNLGAHSGNSSLSSPAVLPVLRQTRNAWISGSRSPSSTRSTSPMASLLRRSFTSRYGANT